VLQPRDRHLLTELARLRVVDREQARLIGGFGSLTRINTRLLALVRAGLLVRVPVGTVRGGHKFVYALSRHGAQLLEQPFRALPVRTDTVLAGNVFLEHQLRINALYLQLAYRRIPLPGIQLRHWRTFQRPISAQVSLLPDAYIELNTPTGIRAMFLEMDLGTESLRIWKRKVAAYLQLAVSGEFLTQFQLPQFRVLVVAPSMRRLNTIRAVVAQRTSKVFWLTTFDTCTTASLWAATWWRPTGEQRQTFF